MFGNKKEKKVLVLVITLLICSLIIMGSLIFRRPTYKQITALQSGMTTKEVVHNLGRLYEDIGSGTIVLRYYLKDRKAATMLTFYQDKLVNVIVKYPTGEIECIIRTD